LLVIDGFLLVAEYTS